MKPDVLELRTRPRLYVHDELGRLHSIYRQCIASSVCIYCIALPKLDIYVVRTEGAGQSLKTCIVKRREIGMEYLEHSYSYKGIKS